MFHGPMRRARPIPPPLTLVILAAGSSTRFGRLKQLTPIGPSGEALLDYALYDGALAGFTRFVLVIQEEKRADFDAHLRPAVTSGLDIRYSYQRLALEGIGETRIPPADADADDRAVAATALVPPPGRTRPWGTGHAMLTAAEHIDGPFALCNADDFYGRGAYAALADAIRGARHEAAATSESTAPAPAPTTEPASATAPAPPTPALTVGYPIEITLSDSGGVSRGICQIDEMGALRKLTEGLQMRRAGDRVRGHDVAGRKLDVPLDAFVCTNLWGFPETANVRAADAPDQNDLRDRFLPESVREPAPGIVSHLQNLFFEFLAASPGTDSEYYLTEAVNELVARGLVHCRVLPTRETWLGVTFPEDHPQVVKSLRGLVDSKVYRRSLWESPPATPSND